MLLTRNHAFRKVSQHSNKTTETSSTPLRNGRKRVLRTSPKICSSVASKAMSSPIRKQPCIEIDTAGTSRRMPAFPRSASKLGLEKSLQHSITRKISSAALKKCYKGLDHTKISTTSADQCVNNAASNKENDLLKRNSISSNKKSTNIDQDYSKKPLSKTEPHQIKRVSTRNSAKKELMSKIIMTRKRLSQENLTIESPYLKRSVKLSSVKSRIPAKSKNIDVPLEKKTSPKIQNLASVKIASVKPSRLKRVSHTSSLKPASSSPLISASSGRLTRRRNI